MFKKWKEKCATWNTKKLTALILSVLGFCVVVVNLNARMWNFLGTADLDNLVSGDKIIWRSLGEPQIRKMMSCLFT